MQAAGEGRIWRDRCHAGDQLGERLAPHVRHHQDTTVVGIPRGGLAVAASLASRLQLPLSCWSVQRVRAPGDGGVLGAIAPGNIQMLDEDRLQELRLSGAALEQLVELYERRMWNDQERFGDPDPAELSHRSLILVDEGIRTGRTMGAALQSLRSLYPAAITVAVPVGRRSAMDRLVQLADRLVVLHPVDQLDRLSDWFASLPTLKETDVVALLRAG
jgi:putative phosphoribosyl transferase